MELTRRFVLMGLTAGGLSLAMLALLESLSPEHRAVQLLHDVFG